MASDGAVMSSTPGALPAVSYLRPIAPKSPLRRTWDRLGWNAAVVVEVVLGILVLEFLISGLKLWSPEFVPAPSAVFGAYFWLAERDLLFNNIVFSLSNFMVGYLLAAVLGISLGLLLGTVPLARTLLGPLVWVAYATPRVALAPLIVLWLGFGPASKIAVIFLMALFPVVVNVWVGATSVDRNLERAGQVFGGSRLDIYRKVILPFILPYTLTGLRLGISRGLVGVVVAEFIGSAAGIGYLIKITSHEFHMDAALALTLILVIAANGAMILLDLLRRRVAPWYREGIA